MTNYIGALTLTLSFLSVSTSALGSPSGLETVDHRDKLYDIFGQGETLWMVGYPGRLLKSSDRGKTWAIQSIKSKEALMAIDFADDNNGLIVGRGGTVLKTADGGKTWSPVKTEITDSVLV